MLFFDLENGDNANQTKSTTEFFTSQPFPSLSVHHNHTFNSDDSSVSIEIETEMVSELSTSISVAKN